MITWLAENFPFYTVLVTLLCGAFALRWDQGAMRQNNLNREAAFSRFIGRMYIGGSVLLWLGIQVALRVTKIR